MVNQVYSHIEDEPVDSGLVSGPVETTGFPIESVDLLEPRRVEPELLAPIPTSTGWEMVAAVPRLLVRYYSTLRAAYGIRFVFMVLIIYGVGQGIGEEVGGGKGRCMWNDVVICMHVFKWLQTVANPSVKLFLQKRPGRRPRGHTEGEVCSQAAMEYQAHIWYVERPAAAVGWAAQSPISRYCR